MERVVSFRHNLNLFLESVKRFAWEELGCGCDEEVFEQVRILRGEASPGPTDTSIVIGENLLVVFADVEKFRPITGIIDHLILTWVTYRDSTGLNRFRLVLYGDVDDSEKKTIEETRERYDERVYVHYFN